MRRLIAAAREAFDNLLQICCGDVVEPLYEVEEAGDRWVDVVER